MPHRTLIVARLEPAHRQRVAELFASSDRTDLPHDVGVSRRTLFGFHDLYFHLIEAESDIGPGLERARSTRLFTDLNSELGRLVRPYDPGWREPRDAMAQPFYEWSNGEPS
ncbi:TcmI family type II polyketide cyclase [Streptomyces sp. NPDC004232]|uniref:TcmI family type II polyketide cyclase n=1 Tax=Streptomyces sp. NPDC004232 TaxID=3154454 RepID=UPI0033BCBBA5